MGGARGQRTPPRIASGLETFSDGIELIRQNGFAMYPQEKSNIIKLSGDPLKIGRVFAS